MIVPLSSSRFYREKQNFEEWKKQQGEGQRAKEEHMEMEEKKYYLQAILIICASSVGREKNTTKANLTADNLSVLMLFFAHTVALALFLPSPSLLSVLLYVGVCCRPCNECHFVRSLLSCSDPYGCECFYHFQ